MIATGGMLGGLLGLTFGHSVDATGFIMVVILLAGLIGSARLTTDSQKPAEVYSGFLVGMTVMFLLFVLI
jgi:predicted lipid-binding transport protein (Tim44 family)